MPLDYDVEVTREEVLRVERVGRPSETLKTLVKTTYGKCVLGLAGYFESALYQMKEFVKCQEPTNEQIATMHESLILYSEAVRDEDNAIFSARIGTHYLLLRLMEHENDLIQDAAAQVVASCTSSIFNQADISFPNRARQLGSINRAKPRQIQLPIDIRDTHHQLNVLIRQVPTRMTGQPKTGYLLWGAAIVLARWIHLHREIFDGKSVLEVGSGLGLGGITAARYASSTTLTDYQDDTCRALEYNVALNAGFTHAIDKTKPDVLVHHLDWDNVDSINKVCEEKVDLIIACDIICEPSTADGFLRVVRSRLDTHGVAYLMNADAHSRFGVSYLHDLLAASDLVYTITKVEDLVDGHILLDTVEDAKELHYECYEIRLPPSHSSVIRTPSYSTGTI